MSMSGLLSYPAHFREDLKIVRTWNVLEDLHELCRWRDRSPGRQVQNRPLHIDVDRFLPIGL